MAEEKKSKIIQLPRRFESKRELEIPERGKFVIKAPTPRMENEAELAYNEAWILAITPKEEGGLGLRTRDELQDLADKRNLFARAEKKYGGSLDEVVERCRDEISEYDSKIKEKKLILQKETLPEVKAEKFKKEIYDLATKMKEKRDKIFQISQEQEKVLGKSADAYAETQRNASLLSSCIFRKLDFKQNEEKNQDGNLLPVWKTPDDFLDEEDDLLINALRLEFTLFSMGLSPDAETLDEIFPEYEILRENKDVG